MRLVLACLAMAWTVPAIAQTTYLRDRNGNLTGTEVSRSNGRVEFRDKNGNFQGYSQQMANGRTEYHDKNGNLVGTATSR